MNKKIKNRYLIILIVFPLILKFILAFIIPGHLEDIGEFERTTDFLLNGKNPFSIQQKYIGCLCYGPMFYLWSFINGIIQLATRLPFYFIVKIFPLIAETLISVILFFSLIKKYSVKKSFYWALIFSINPVTLSVSAIHGQFDMVPLLMIVLAYYFFQSNNAKIRRILPGICLGLGASFKYFFPLLISVVSFFKYREIKEKLKFAITVITTLFITYTPLILSGDFILSIQKQLFFTPPPNWGIAKFLLLAQKINHYPQLIAFMENLFIEYGKILLGVIMIVTILLYSKVKSLKRSYEVVFYCFYTVSFFMHPQYLVWVIPFLFLDINLKEIIYLIPLTGHLYFLYIIKLITSRLDIFFGYDAFFSAISFIFGIIIWLYCLFMYIRYIKEDLKCII